MERSFLHQVWRVAHAFIGAVLFPPGVARAFCPYCMQFECLPPLVRKRVRLLRRGAGVFIWGVPLSTSCCVLFISIVHFEYLAPLVRKDVRLLCRRVSVSIWSVPLSTRCCALFMPTLQFECLAPLVPKYVRLLCRSANVSITGGPLYTRSRACFLPILLFGRVLFHQLLRVVHDYIIV